MNSIVPWQPQPNNIYHMDALTLLKHMPDNSVDLIVTDPPYRTNITSRSIKGAAYKKLANDKWQYESNWVYDAMRVLKPRGVFYIFIGQKDISYLKTDITAFGGKTVALLAWIKTNPLFSSTRKVYRPAIELAIYGCKGAVGYFRKDATQEEDLLPYRFYPIVQGRERTSHPTQKPLMLIQEYINNSSKVGDIILDPFIGSGTTAVAAQRLGRQYIGCDISAEYVEIARRRVQNADPYQQTTLGNGLVQKSLFAKVMNE